MCWRRTNSNQFQIHFIVGWATMRDLQHVRCTVPHLPLINLYSLFFLERKTRPTCGLPSIFLKGPSPPRLQQGLVFWAENPKPRGTRGPPKKTTCVLLWVVFVSLINGGAKSITYNMPAARMSFGAFAGEVKCSSEGSLGTPLFIGEVLCTNSK